MNRVLRHPAAWRQWMSCSLVAAALVLAGCDDDNEQQDPTPEVVEPIAITQQARSLVIDDHDQEVVAASPELSPELVASNFQRVILRRQLHDELTMNEDLTGDPTVEATDRQRSFPVRIEALWQVVAQEYPKFSSVVIVLDLLTVDRTRLVAPTSIRERDRTFQPQSGLLTKYPKSVMDQAEEAITHLSKVIPSDVEVLFVIGDGLNGLEAAEYQAFKSYYINYLQPMLRSVAKDQGRTNLRVTTALDYEAFLSRSDAAAALAGGEGSTDDRLPHPADASTWQELTTGLLDKIDLLVLRSYPSQFETPEAIPDDHYQRLRPLLQASQPVAFLSLYWRCTSTDDTAGARGYLKRFRTLAGNYNLAFLAWPRFTDLGEQRCRRYSQTLGGPKELCYAGLVNSSGKLKTLWREMLDESVPSVAK